MAPAGFPIIMALIFCSVCIEIPGTASAPPPSADLISVCPAFNSSICRYARPVPPKCFNDNQCSDSKKCCCSGTCSLECKVPEKVKVGRCPDIKAKCNPEFTYNCTSDSDCTGNKKCCSICGTKCWDPEPETFMNCPNKESDSLQCGSVHCTRDSDCKTKEKCCASENGRSCVKPMTGGLESGGWRSGQEQNVYLVKPGKCPSNINCIWATYTCKKDSDCTEDQKCCGICGKNCWKPE